MKMWSKTTVGSLVCLGMMSGALAQQPEPGKDVRRERKSEDAPHEMRAGGMQRMGGRDEPSRESMLARFVTDREVAKKLGLSEEQIEKLKARSIELRKHAIRLKADQELAGMEQVELLSSDEINEDALMAAIEKNGRIHTEMAKLQIAPIIELKKTLTPEQLAQAKQMLNERMRLHMRDGAGARERDGQRGPDRRPPPRGGERGGPGDGDRRPPPGGDRDGEPQPDGPPPMASERD